MHQRGIVHGDLKCNNILVSKTGIAMLTDFGQSCMPAQDGRSREPIGAFQWKAPELFEPDCRAPTFEPDIYAFGMCVVEAWRGGSPWGSQPDAAIRYTLVKMKRAAAQAGYQRSISTCITPRPGNVKSDQHWGFVEQLCAFEPSERLKLNEAISILEKFAQDEATQCAQPPEIA
ncbi:hypothetical protein ON010_g9697 [Phytophthora cinnamomi]|nr:hypothetical protein ON010_g9697 [Phytophthora cinnamomi]